MSSVEQPAGRRDFLSRFAAGAASLMVGATVIAETASAAAALSQARKLRR